MTKGAKHSVTIRTALGATRSPSGIASTLYRDTFVPNVRVAAPNLSNNETGGDSAGYGQVDAVTRVPKSVIADENSHVLVASTGLLGLDGEYVVVGVRPNELDTRLLLRRRVT